MRVNLQKSMLRWYFQQYCLRGIAIEVGRIHEFVPYLPCPNARTVYCTSLVQEYHPQYNYYLHDFRLGDFSLPLNQVITCYLMVSSGELGVR